LRSAVAFVVKEARAIGLLSHERCDVIAWAHLLNVYANSEGNEADQLCAARSIGSLLALLSIRSGNVARAAVTHAMNDKEERLFWEAIMLVATTPRERTGLTLTMPVRLFSELHVAGFICKKCGCPVHPAELEEPAGAIRLGLQTEGKTGEIIVCGTCLKDPAVADAFAQMRAACIPEPEPYAPAAAASPEVVN